MREYSIQVMTLLVSIAIFIGSLFDLSYMGAIYIESYVKFAFWGGILSLLLLPFAYYITKRFWPSFSVYIPSFFLFLLSLSLIFTYHFVIANTGSGLNISAFFAFFYLLLALLIVLRFLYSYERKSLTKGFVFLIYLYIMLFIGGLFIYSSFANDPQILVGSIYDDESPAGVPYLFSNAITIFSMQFTITFSIQLTIIFGIIGSFLIENFRMIFDQAKKKMQQGKAINKFSGVSYAFAGLSCQCEATTSLLPAIGSEILGIVSLPLVMESLFLTILTFVVLKLSISGFSIRFFAKIKKLDTNKLKFIFAGVLFVVLEPVVLIVGIFLGLRENLLFYASINALMFITGIIIIFLLHSIFKIFSEDRSKFYILWSAIGSVVLMVMWYLPAFVNFSLESGINYSLMAIVSTAGGLLAGYSLVTSGRNDRIVALEYVGGMLPVISIIILYFTAVSTLDIWPIFGITQQLYFSIIFLAISLPIMWFFTNYAIYDFSTKINS
jgi:hypothetical protein